MRSRCGEAGCLATRYQNAGSTVAWQDLNQPPIAFFLMIDRSFFFQAVKGMS